MWMKVQARIERVCIFDFDETLWMRDAQKVAKEAKDVIQSCVNHGYGIAIATANPYSGHVRQVLQDKISKKVFTTDFLYSDAFQYGREEKKISLKNALEFYRLDSAPECAVLFDDNKKANKKHADAVGVQWVHVNENRGVRSKDFQKAQRKLDKFCPIE